MAINLKKGIYVPSLQYNYWASQCKEKGFELEDAYSDLGDNIFLEGDLWVYSVHDCCVYAILGDKEYFLYHIN